MGLIECGERGLGEGKLGSRCSCPPWSSRRPSFRVPMGRLAWCSSPSSGRQESWGSPSLSPTLELCLVLSLLEEGAWLLPGGWTQLAPRLGQSGSDQPQALGLLVLAVPSLPRRFPEHSYHGGRWACGPCGPCLVLAVTYRPDGRHFPMSSLLAGQELSILQMRKLTLRQLVPCLGPHGKKSQTLNPNPLGSKAGLVLVPCDLVLVPGS